MGRELVFISAQPDDIYYSWQTEIFIENIRSLGYEQEIQVLLFVPKDRPLNKRYYNLSKRYKDQNVKFFWYMDEEVNKDYIPLLRLQILEKHFQRFPELEKKAIFYHDSDIIFTNKWDIDKFKDDNVNYFSDTSHYLDIEYFKEQSKLLPEGIQYDYKRVFSELLGEVNISENLATKPYQTYGGAQYILKNIDHTFWRDVKEDALKIRLFFKNNIIPTYFSGDKRAFNNGWCADMWALLFNLWKRKRRTFTPKELNFSFAEYPIELACNIHHETGVTEANFDKMFNKKRKEFIEGTLTPFSENLSFVSPNYCSFLYKQAIDLVKSKYYFQYITN